MEPIYFGEDANTFGFFHPSPAVQSQKAVLICPPTFVDFYRTHQIVRETAIQLNNRGYDVFRFDFQGTGDSGGSLKNTSLKEWIENIVSATHELIDITGIKKINVIGIRFSAALALLALANKEIEHVSRLLLWDPIISGEGYIKELKQVQQNFYDRYRTTSRLSYTDLVGTELTGHDCSPSLIQSINSIDVQEKLENCTSKIDTTLLRSDSHQKYNSLPYTQINANCNWQTMTGSMLMDKEIIEKLVRSLEDK